MRRVLYGLSALLLALAVGCSHQPQLQAGPGGNQPPLPAGPDPALPTTTEPEPPIATPEQPGVILPQITVHTDAKQPFQPKQFAFADPQHGWIADGTRIMATEDGGAIWANLPLLPSDAHTMAMIGTAGWVGTAKGLYTLKAGHWTQLDTGAFTSLSFVDTTHGWAYMNFQLQRTSDGGATWAPVTNPCPGDDFGRRLSFTSTTTGWVICPSQGGTGMQSKNLFHTQDGGQTWQEVAHSGGFGQPPGSLPAGGYVANLFFLDDSHGWISLSRSVIIATDDGGQSWHGLPGSEPEVVFPGTAQFFSATDGLAILQSGGNWVLHRTSDGGKSWAPVYPAIKPVSPLPKQMLDAQTWVTSGTVANQGAILWTHDAGAHWAQVGALPKAVSALSFLDQKQGWALDQDGQVYATTNGGATWQPLAASPGAPEEHLFRIHFTSPTTGYAFSGWGHIYQTTDGGESFTLLSNNDATMNTDLAGQKGWRITTDFHLQATNDGGKTWQDVGLNTRAIGLEVVSPDVAWVIGGQIEGGTQQPVLFSTKDGGTHWSRYEMVGVNLNAIRFADAEHGLLLDQDYRLFATNDGGQSWTQLP